VSSLETRNPVAPVAVQLIEKAEELIGQASGCPDYGLAMKALIEAKNLMERACIGEGCNIFQQWEIVYEAVVSRQTPENLPSIYA
jgi:hypothetical protein